MGFFRRWFCQRDDAPEVQFQIDKCPIPIIWLDTSVIVDLTKLRLGGLNGDIPKKRLSQLQKSLCDLTSAGKLLCPKAGQPNEIWKKRSDFLATIDELSLGISTCPKPVIEEIQTQQLMAAYIAGTRLVTLTYTDPFIDDPVDRLERAYLSNYIVAVDTPPTTARITEIKSRHDSIFEDWKKLRETCVKQSVTFDQQLKVERAAGMRMTLSMARDCFAKLCRGERVTAEEMSSFLYIQRLTHTWNRLRGRPKGLKGLVRFLYSPYCQVVPAVSINEALTARLVTEKGRDIQPGDAMDVEHISSILPYANLMIVDKGMKNIVHALRLDERYRTTVCWIGDDDELRDFFEDVGKSAQSHSPFLPFRNDRDNQTA
jgi:hypothetical protein